MLGKISQTQQEYMQYMHAVQFPHRKYQNMHNWSTITESRLSEAEEGVGGLPRRLGKFRGRRNVLYLDCSGGYTSVYGFQNSNITLKMSLFYSM